MAIPSLIKSEFPDRAPISIGESGLGGASSIHVVQQIGVRILISKVVVVVLADMLPYH